MPDTISRPTFAVPHATRPTHATPAPAPRPLQPPPASPPSDPDELPPAAARPSTAPSPSATSSSATAAASPVHELYGRVDLGPVNADATVEVDAALVEADLDATRAAIASVVSGASSQNHASRETGVGMHTPSAPPSGSDEPPPSNPPPATASGDERVAMRVRDIEDFVLEARAASTTPTVFLALRCNGADFDLGRALAAAPRRVAARALTKLALDTVGGSVELAFNVRRSANHARVAMTIAALDLWGRASEEDLPAMVELVARAADLLDGFEGLDRGERADGAWTDTRTYLRAACNAALDADADLPKIGRELVRDLVDYTLRGDVGWRDSDDPAELAAIVRDRVLREVALAQPSDPSSVTGGAR